MAKRYDYANLTATRTDEGYLVDSPIVARTGILIYRNADGTVRKELRRAADVFHADSLNTLKGKPITVDHPSGLVNSKNIKNHHIGTMLSPGRQDGDNVRADIIIHQPDAIGERRQLSLGYDVDLDETPGEYNGERYDAVQTNIRVNHLSVVKSARAGAQARLNLDSDEEPLITELEMPKIRLDNGIEYEAAPEVIVQIEKMRTDATQVATQLTDKSKQLDTVTAERDSLKARVDGIPAEIETAKSKAVEIATKQIENRSKLETAAKSVKFDCAGKTDEEIKHAVIKSFNKDADLTGKSEDYINAAFDFAMSQRKDSAMSEQRQVVNGGRNDSADKRDHAQIYRDSLGSNGVKPKD